MGYPRQQRLAFNEEYTKLRPICCRLDYQLSLIDSVFLSIFDSRNPSVSVSERKESNIVKIGLPFKDQLSANAVRRQLRYLSNKIGPKLQPVFVSKKLEQGQNLRSIVNQQCVVNHFVCDLCDADYIEIDSWH